jgi:hypothetical protein
MRPTRRCAQARTRHALLAAASLGSSRGFRTFEKREPSSWDPQGQAKSPLAMRCRDAWAECGQVCAAMLWAGRC